MNYTYTIIVSVYHMSTYLGYQKLKLKYFTFKIVFYIVVEPKNN